MYINLLEPCFLKYDKNVIPFLPNNITVTCDGNISIEGHKLCLEHFANPLKVQAMKIERVIFNNPATIVIWSDKTKTVVKCQPGDTYDPEKGLALCISKKFLGNKGNFNEVFKKWVPEVVEDDDAIRVGSRVEVVRCGLLYSTYKRWVDKNVKVAADRKKWTINVRVRNHDVGYVKYIAEHETDPETLAYVDFGTYCAIIGIKGLKKIK